MSCDDWSKKYLSDFSDDKEEIWNLIVQYRLAYCRAKVENDVSSIKQKEQLRRQLMALIEWRKK